MSEFKEKGFTLDNGKFLGADDFMKSVQEANPAAFETTDNSDGPRFNSGGDHGDDQMTDAFSTAVLAGAGLKNE
ncbi:hypothetical protein Q5O14_17940 [Eubacteriaceae bacterium ES2]|nr:hypothetical protein Q5O14_17940 [Eubacteriaceae bacterium ES2]